MLAGLLGNVGFKSEEDDSYLGARGIKLLAPPRRAPHEQEAGPLDQFVAELVETTRLFGRGLANIEPQWIWRAGWPATC